MQRTGFLYRALGSIIDAVIFGVILLVFVLVLVFVMGDSRAEFLEYGKQLQQTRSFGNAPVGIKLLLCLPYLLAMIVVFVPEVFIGATPAKCMLGIRIRTEEGAVAPFSTLLFRFCIKHIGLLSVILGSVCSAFLGAGVSAIAVVGGLGSLCISLGVLCALGESRQTLHDKISGTAVYPKESGTDLDNSEIVQPISTLSTIVPPRRDQAKDPNDLFKPRW